MSRASAYPAYKQDGVEGKALNSDVSMMDSGVDWLGEVPDAWRLKPLWSMFHREKTTGFPDEELLSVYRDYGVIPKDSRPDNLNKTAENRDIYQRVDAGWLVANRMKAWQGSVGISGQRGIVSGHYIVFRPTHSESPEFLNLLFRSGPYTLGYRTLSRGVRIDQAEIDNVQYRVMPVLLPPIEEQRAIVEYVNRETSYIDELCGKQERLIDVLSERRSAMIAHAVTRGLDSGVSMKESGVAWVDSIPESWVMRRVSWLFGTISSGTTPANEDLLDEGGDHYWVTTGELRERQITETRKTVSEETLESNSALRLYGPGTLLMAMYGATIGRLGILDTWACTNQACCAMAEPKGVETRFVYYALIGAKEHLLQLASGGGQPNINQEKIRALRLPVPALNEQLEIVAYLDRATAKIDALIDKAKVMNVVLRERRSALISAAVTGKIDVTKRTKGAA